MSVRVLEYQDSRHLINLKNREGDWCMGGGRRCSSKYRTVLPSYLVNNTGMCK